MIDFSIVVPTYERPENLRQLLSSLSHLEYPSSRLEVIVVDDGSKVQPSKVVAGFQERLNVCLLQQPNAGPGAARNLGARQARGRFLAFTDDDCRPEPLWLHAYAHALNESEHVVCGGRSLNILVPNIYSEATQMLADYLFEHYSPVHVSGGFFPANNLAIAKDSFWEAGGFDSQLRYGEDRDFCYRCASLRYLFRATHDAIVHHVHPLTLRSFLRLHYCYGRGTFEFRRGCAAKGLPPVPISPPGWYAMLVLAGVQKERTLRGTILTLLLLASQAAGVFAMVWGNLAKKNRIPGVPGVGS